MADRMVARRYARAFLGVAVEQDKVGPLADDLQRVVDTGRANGGELFHALSNPAFTVEERKAVLRSVLERLGVQQLTKNLLQLLLDKGRFPIVEDLASTYLEIADEQRGRQRVVVETATPM